MDDTGEVGGIPDFWEKKLFDSILADSVSEVKTQPLLSSNLTGEPSGKYHGGVCDHLPRVVET